jgi:hypothetical protein
LLSLLSLLLSLLDKVFGYATTVDTTKLQTQAQVDVESTQEMGQVETKWWFVAATIPLFSLPFIVYTWKAVAWDKVIGPIFGYASVTDPINGTLGWVFTTVVIGLFLHAMVR